MRGIQGKWMYNTGSEEHWVCDEGEFDTKEEAISAGIKYFTEPDGYEEEQGEEFEGDSFDVGQIAYPEIYINPWNAIEQAQECAYNQCGEFSEEWLSKVSKEDEKLLSDMLKSTFNEWIIKTSNEPKYFTLKHISEVKLPIKS